MERRDFMKGLGMLLAATVVPVNKALTTTLPPEARIIQPADSLFLVETVRVYNKGTRAGKARLVVGDFQLTAGVVVRPGDCMNFQLYPGGGYQLDPGEEVALIGAPDFQVVLMGQRCWPHGRDAAPGPMEVMYYSYWATARKP